MISAVKAVSEQVGRRHGASRTRPGCAIERPPVIPIIGARKGYLNSRTISPALDLVLSAEQLKSLDGSKAESNPDSLRNIYDREMVRAIRYGGTWDRFAALSWALQAEIGDAGGGGFKLPACLPSDGVTRKLTATMALRWIISALPTMDARSAHVGLVAV